MNTLAYHVNTRLPNVRPTRKFVNGLVKMKGLDKDYADELALLETLWSEALTTRAPASLSAAREYEAILLRHISASRQLA